MITLEEKCDRLIKTVKMHTGADILFIRAYGAEKIRTPVDAYYACVSVDEAGESGYVGDRDCMMVTAGLRLRLFAPRSDDGAKLFEKCRDIAGIMKREGGDIVETVSVCEIRYDTKARSFYRDIKAKLCFREQVTV